MNRTANAPEPRQSNNQFDPPDWRWRMANLIAEGIEKVSKYTDRHVRALVAHLAARSGAATSGYDLAIANALAIFLDAPLGRIETEARIVAGESDREISIRLGVEEETITYYRSLFFEVPPAAVDYIAVHVVGIRGLHEFRDQDVKQYWIWMAMQGGGPVIVDMLMKSMRVAHRDEKHLQLSDCLRKDRQIHPGIQLSVALNVIPREGLWAEWWIKFRVDWADAETISSEVARASETLRLQVALMQTARSVLAGEKTPPLDRLSRGVSRNASRRSKKPMTLVGNKAGPQPNQFADFLQALQTFEI